MNSLVVGTTRGLLGSIGRSGKRCSEAIDIPCDQQAFVVSFCGSGTGHMMQALTLTRVLQASGMQLTGVITDTDAAQNLLDEVIKPLEVPVLILPAITIVNAKGILPPHRVLGKAVVCMKGLRRENARIRAFLATSQCSLLINMWQISLGKFLQLNPLPPSVRVVHVAAQFAHLALKPSQVKGGFMAAAAKGTIDVMATIFKPSGVCVAISGAASAASGAPALAPIIDVPISVAEQPPPSPLLLCYFLTMAPARRLERLLHKQPIPGVEVHCFTAEALTAPHGRSLSLHSHIKQRKLFQELFARCTAVLCSTGNETIWEAVCRGVPVLTIPTAGHGEQILNASVHARALPESVRSRSTLSMADLRWLVSFEHSDASRRESEVLRERCAALEKTGGLAPLLGSAHGHADGDAATGTAALSRSSRSELAVTAATTSVYPKVQ